MEHETKIERKLDRAMARASKPRGAAILIASTVSTITVIAGLSMTLIDPSGFPTIGTGLWWAVQTVTTVGYGDRVPKTAAGQLVAALVMLLGIAFVTVTTASITGAFVAQTRTRNDGGSPANVTAEQLRAIEKRLAGIEAALNERR
jgi:voltage-gated potassium channel